MSLLGGITRYSPSESGSKPALLSYSLRKKFSASEIRRGDGASSLMAAQPSNSMGDPSPSSWLMKRKKKHSITETRLAKGIHHRTTDAAHEYSGAPFLSPPTYGNLRMKWQGSCTMVDEPLTCVYIHVENWPHRLGSCHRRLDEPSLLLEASYNDNNTNF